jgi:hypothetical protein
MLPVLILLLVGTLGYLFWRRMTTTLTRECRWRQTGPGHWRCSFCGATADGETQPTHCPRWRG